MHKQNGVNLMELMVVVAIIGILAAIGYPSYRNQLLRSHRAEAKSALLQVQVAQEKYFLQNNAYATTAALLSAAQTASPAGLGIPATTTGGYYTITVATNGAAPSYIATATVTTKQDDDITCKTFTVDHTGLRASTDKDGADSSGCWQ